MNDRDIVLLYEARSEQAIRETTERYGRYVKEIAKRILENDEDAEECVNDTLLSAWNAIPPHHPENLKGFLGKLARNNAIRKYMRSNAKKRREDRYAVALDELEDVIPNGAGVSSLEERIVVRDALNRFLRGLPKRTRIIFMRRYFYMCSVSEIAEDLEMREGTVRTTLCRTREKLKEFLKKEGLML